MKENNMESVNVLHGIFARDARWIESFEMQIPQMSTCYGDLLSNIWAKGILTNKEKCLILIAIWLSQGRSATLREKINSLQESSQVKRVELLDVISTVLISRGPVALTTAWESGILTNERDGAVLPCVDSDAEENREQILDYFRKNMGRVPDWIRLLDETMPEGVKLYYNWRNKILIDSVLPRKIKELMLVAVNAVSLYKEGMRIHAMGFMKAGGSREELLEGLLMAFIGGGIVAWIEGVTVLTESEIL